MDMVRFSPDEQPRSLQLYGVDPVTVSAEPCGWWSTRTSPTTSTSTSAARCPRSPGAAAARRCRTSGGSSRRSSATAVDAARPAGIPVTVKMRIGIDPDHVTYTRGRPDRRGLRRRRGRAARSHRDPALLGQPRTGSAIARLKETVTIDPGAGQRRHLRRRTMRWRMMAETGCDGVVVGRGCQGRPWLFADLAAAFDGRTRPTAARPAGRHRGAAPACELLMDEMGADRGIRDLRKHIPWYLQGVRGGLDGAAGHGHGVEPGRPGSVDRRHGPGPALPGRRRRPAGTAGFAAVEGAPAGGLAGRPGRICRAARPPSWTRAAADVPSGRHRRIAVVALAVLLARATVTG